MGSLTAAGSRDKNKMAISIRRQAGNRIVGRVGDVGARPLRNVRELFDGEHVAAEAHLDARGLPRRPLVDQEDGVARALDARVGVHLHGEELAAVRGVLPERVEAGVHALGHARLFAPDLLALLEGAALEDRDAALEDEAGALRIAVGRRRAVGGSVERPALLEGRRVEGVGYVGHGVDGVVDGVIHRRVDRRRLLRDKEARAGSARDDDDGEGRREGAEPKKRSRKRSHSATLALVWPSGGASTPAYLDKRHADGRARARYASSWRARLLPRSGGARERARTKRRGEVSLGQGANA